MIKSKFYHGDGYSRFETYPSTTRQRNAICSLLATLKRFELVPNRTRWYINSGEFPPMVDVIYETR